jgi:predicted Rossmann fold flavoprotein
MQKYTVAVIGGGASGIAAAISAKRNGSTVALCEKMPSLGRKILASGNGRCNLSNEDLSEDHYNYEAWPLVRSVFSRFGGRDILRLFDSLGLKTYSDCGRVFPATNQSASVLKVLEIELRRLAVDAIRSFDVQQISRGADGFHIRSRSGRSISSDKVIIAGGGRSYPALGSDGSAYKLVEDFGHEIVEPVPAGVPLVVKDPMIHALQGQKIAVRARAVIGGKPLKEVSGDLLFTNYGLSGTAILDISEDISVAMNRKKINDVSVSIDMVPFMEGSELASELAARLKRGWPAEELICGILPNKFALALKGVLAASPDPRRMATAMKVKIFKVSGTRGWNEADFTSGGVDILEVDEKTLRSKLKKGVYLAGEILDVTGRRGGYNLAWAWASGYIAGLME